MAILSTFVRLGILLWEEDITLNYVTFPGMTEQDKIDPTFIARSSQEFWYFWG